MSYRSEGVIFQLNSLPGLPCSAKSGFDSTKDKVKFEQQSFVEEVRKKFSLVGGMFLSVTTTAPIQTVLQIGHSPFWNTQSQL